MFDYGLALLKTSTSMVYTVQLADARRLAVATDSQVHFTLLARTAKRDGINLENYWIERSGYYPFHPGLLEFPNHADTLDASNDPGHH